MTMALGAITYLDRVTHLGHPALRRPRSQSQSDADGLCVQRVLSRLRAVRDSHRLVGRPGRHATGPDADRLLVVRVHRAHRLRVQLFVAGGDSVPVRQRRGRRVAECRADVFAVVPAAGARHGAGHVLHGRAPRRRADADAGDGAARLPELAVAVRPVRIDWVRLVVGLVSMVSRFAGGASRRRRGRARADRERARRRCRPRARSRRSGSGCWRTARWCVCA